MYSSFPLKGLDNNLINKILNSDYQFNGSIEFLARLEDFHGEENTLTYTTNESYYSKAVELGYKYIITNSKTKVEKENLELLYSDNPRHDFIKIVDFLNNQKLYSGISKSIGDNVVIGNNVIINENTIVNDRVIIGNFCVIGGKGYDVDLLNKNLVYTGIHGGLYIGNNSIIRNFVNIDSSIWGQNTIIEKNVAIDSHVLIGHDVSISEGVNIRGGSTIAGFSKIGKNSIIGIETVMTQRSEIGENSLTTAGSIISKKYPPNSKILSFPPKVQKI